MACPLDGTPSTHILKPDIKRLAGSVINEAFCMILARLCGLDAAEVTIGRAGKRDYLLVRRYDRVADGQGIIRRIHQEDFCQLLGLFPAEKYEHTGLGRPAGASLQCAAPYRQVDQSLPQALAGKRNADELHGNDWRQFATDVGLSPAAVTRRVEELAVLVATRADEALEQTLSYPVSNREFSSRLVFFVRKRCRRIELQISR